MSDIKYRIGWLSRRIELTENDKEYIEFQMNNLVNETLKQAKNNEVLDLVSNSVCECCNENEAKVKVNICHSCDEHKLNSTDC